VHICCTHLVVFLEIAMQPFIFSALLSFVIFESLVFTDVLPRRRGWFRLGGVTVRLNPTSEKWARRGLIAIFAVILLLGILLVHEEWPQLSEIQAHKTNIVLGFVFGPLFAAWLNAVVSHPPDKPLAAA
jgi:hypothetical protein